MRVIQSKTEFYIRCECGLEIAYPPHEETLQYFQCPKCKKQIQKVSNKLLISTVQEIMLNESDSLPSP